MKKLITLLISIFLMSFSFAQFHNLETFHDEGIPTKEVKKQLTSVKGTKDTIFYSDWKAVGQPTTGTVTGWKGFMFGTGWRGVDSITSKFQAQGYIVNAGNTYKIEEVLIWAHTKKKISATGSNMVVTITKIDGTSSYTVATVPYTINCPKTVLATATATWNSIDTGMVETLTKVTFPTPVPVFTDYAIVMDFSNFYTNKDSIGVVAGAVGTASLNSLEFTWYSYYIQSSGASLWTQHSHIFSTGTPPVPADRAPAIFPVVDKSTAGIESNVFQHGLKMSQNYPNPSTHESTISFEVEKTSDAYLIVFDMNGKVVYENNFEKVEAGKIHSIILNIENFTSGTYYYSIMANGQRLTKKMIVH